MRGLAAVALLVLAIGGPVRAQDVEAAIQGVISDQIAAFEHDDFATAFTYASPTIRQLFGSPDRFGEMVRQGYPMVWHPGEVRFAELEERDGRTLQRVLVTDDAGALHVLEYEMVSVDGAWRIDGVRLLEEGSVGA